MKSYACVFVVLLACSVAGLRAGTVLFVDDHDVLYRSGTRRVLHQPQRYADNPVLVGPTIKNQVSYNSVYRDPATGRWQMWYQITSGSSCAVAYAESKDGISWAKLELDLVELKNMADRNIVLTSPGHYDASVVVDPPGGDPARRYKMAYWSIPVDSAKDDSKDRRGSGGGMFVAFSPDGMHWTKQPGPALRGTYGRIGDPPLAGEADAFGPPASVSDVLDAIFDPLRGKYVVQAKTWIDAPDGRMFWKRAIARTESQDFLQWSTPQLIMAPDEHDGLRPSACPGTRQGVQLHGAPAFVRHGVYFALVQLADFETHGQQPIELAISRDGLAWSRPFRDQLFLPVGKPDQFDAARIWSNATPVVLGDEIRFYYGGAENPWTFGKEPTTWKTTRRVPKTGIGFATLPLDRFTGLSPLEKIAQVTLRPRTLGGMKQLTLNADATGGAIRVELLDAAGYRLSGFSKAEATPLTGDNLRHRATWKDANLTRLPAGDVMIRIHLKNAELFALTIE